MTNATVRLGWPDVFAARTVRGVYSIWKALGPYAKPILALCIVGYCVAMMLFLQE